MRRCNRAGRQAAANACAAVAATPTPWLRVFVHAGMFSEAYIIFSLGLTKPLQTAQFPTCFKTHEDCSEELTHVQNYIQICGIIVGEHAGGAMHISVPLLCISSLTPMRAPAHA